jgi:predicted RNase H-like HicB family nuclease
LASRKRTRVQAARSRVSDKRPGFLPNIADLIDEGGQISVGGIGPIKCAAVANDEYQCYAMLQRRPGETLQQLLERLDAAIDTAITTEEMIDEINAPPDSKPHKPSRRY